MVLDDADMIRGIKNRLHLFQVIGIYRMSLVETETLIQEILAVCFFDGLPPEIITLLEK